MIAHFKGKKKPPDVIVWGLQGSQLEFLTFCRAFLHVKKGIANLTTDSRDPGVSRCPNKLTVS